MALKSVANWLVGQEVNEWAMGSAKVCELGVNGTEGKRMGPHTPEPPNSDFLLGSLPLYQPMNRDPPPPSWFWKSAIPLLAGTTHRF